MVRAGGGCSLNKIVIGTSCTYLAHLLDALAQALVTRLRRSGPVALGSRRHGVLGTREVGPTRFFCLHAVDPAVVMNGKYMGSKIFRILLYTLVISTCRRRESVEPGRHSRQRVLGTCQTHATNTSAQRHALQPDGGAHPLRSRTHTGPGCVAVSCQAQGARV